MKASVGTKGTLKVKVIRANPKPTLRERIKALFGHR